MISAQNIDNFSHFSGLIVAISTFTGGARQAPPSGGDYFIGFIITLIAIGWVVAAVADFFMLTKVKLTLHILVTFCVSLIPIIRVCGKKVHRNIIMVNFGD